MMQRLTCQECQTQRWAYLSGELPPRLRQPVKHHLQTCELCRRVFQTDDAVRWRLRRVLPALGAESQPSVPRAWAGVRNRLARPLASRLPKRYGVLLLIALVGMALPLIWNTPKRYASPPTPPTPKQMSMLITPTAEGASEVQAPLVVGTPVSLFVEPLPVAGMNTP